MYHQRTQKNKTRQLDLFADAAADHIRQPVGFKPMATPAADPLVGLAVRLPNELCKCGSDTAIISAGLMRCRSCGRARGWLPKFTADWIATVISLHGRPGKPIILRRRRP